MQVEKDPPTAEQAYNFFTLNHEPDPPSESERLGKKKKQRDGTEGERGDTEAEEAAEGEHKQDHPVAQVTSADYSWLFCLKQLKRLRGCLVLHSLPQSEEAPLVRNEEDLFIIDQSPQDFLVTRRAEYVGYHKRLQQEGELLFTPSLQAGKICSDDFRTRVCDFQVLVKLIVYWSCFILTVPPSIKLPENMKPRFLEDEGLYVGERPTVSLTNENILENRILKTEEVSVASYQCIPNFYS